MITTKLYGFLDRAMEYFNEHLFEKQLPDCILTLNRKAKTYGYHHHDKFKSRDGEERRTEISLNPDGFTGRSVEEVLSTLAHEMVHAQQYVLGEPPRKGYHDKNFASLMFAIGLQTSSTGEFGGKPTGQKMTHYILDGRDRSKREEED
jgi:predicted SprT family Zn-dependent metalloprotease